MRTIILPTLLFISYCGFSQTEHKTSSIDFVEALDGYKAEALFYYQNNWQVLREMALEKGYIQAYQFMEVPYSKEMPYHFMLITTYANKEQYDKREANFEKLIKARGELRLKNDKKPNEFRKVLYGTDEVKHWN